MAANPENQSAHLAKAMALLRAWDESEDDQDEPVQRMVVSYLEGAADVTEVAQRLTELTTGLLSLNVRLLLELSQHTGKSIRELLEIIDRRVVEGT